MHMDHLIEFKYLKPDRLEMELVRIEDLALQLLVPVKIQDSWDYPRDS